MPLAAMRRRSAIVLAIGLALACVAGAAPPVDAPASASPRSSDTPGYFPAAPGEDAMRAVSVPSPYRIPEQAALGTIRYRIAMRDGIPWHWAETGEQHVVQDGDTVVVTVCRTCGREAAPTADELQRALQRNPWADNGDAVVRMFASDLRGATVDRRMRNLVDAVRQQMSGHVDFSRYLTSREAYEAQRGDCSEAAVLLAAAAKARHIPVRVVFGMAYASRFLGMKRVFWPHMWVQAWTGERWTSYDAGLGEFDSTHIALAVGDGSPDTLVPAVLKLPDVRIVSAEGVLPALAASH